MNLQTHQETDHTISQDLIDPNALEIIRRLKEAGYQAYLVGGGVRDLLLGIPPKDFDISTSAEPREIKSIFHKNCFLIGKRFRLAHLRFGNKIFEVSTFRSGDLNSSSLITRDNLWGTAEEDVLRRDFTVNALFYDPENHTILDYVGGYEDIKQKLLRSIGDPILRFRQDPVRMIRLLKFRARFGFTVDPETERALCLCKEEIMKSAPARLLEELFKMLESGFASPFFELLKTYDFLELLCPCFSYFFGGPNKEIAYQYLRAIDQEIGQQHELDRSLLMAALVFPILEQELHTLSRDRQTALALSETIHLSYALLRGINTSSLIHFPRKLLATAHHIIVQQFRFTPLQGKPRWNARINRSWENGLAIEFLRLRAKVSPELSEFYTNWKEIFTKR